MKILFYGAGVLGSLLAVRLHAAGHEVRLLARGKRLEDLRQHGVILEDAATGVRTTAWVPVVDSLQPDDVYDLIVVLLRKNQVADVLPILAANTGTPAILFLGNNAAGPGAYTAAVGRERVLTGFAVAGGAREGHIVRYMAPDGQIKVIAGELHGRFTPRLHDILAAFADGGIAVEACPAMDAWLKTHVAVISPLANAFYAAGSSLPRAASTPDAIVLGIRAVREGLRVIRASGMPIMPPRMVLLERLPEPLLVLLLSRTARSPLAEIAMAAHASAARDEMAALTEEFRALAAETAVPTPAIDALARYLDPDMPPMPERSAAIPMQWRGMLLTVIVGFLLLNAAVNLLAYLAGWLARDRMRRDR